MCFTMCAPLPSFFLTLDRICVVKTELGKLRPSKLAITKNKNTDFNAYLVLSIVGILSISTVFLLSLFLWILIELPLNLSIGLFLESNYVFKFFTCTFSFNLRISLVPNDGAKEHHSTLAENGRRHRKLGRRWNILSIVKESQ